MGCPTSFATHSAQSDLKNHCEKIPYNPLQSQPTLSTLAMQTFHPLTMLWIVVPNWPHVNLKKGPVCLSTNKNSRVLEGHQKSYIGHIKYHMTLKYSCSSNIVFNFNYNNIQQVISSYHSHEYVVVRPSGFVDVPILNWLQGGTLLSMTNCSSKTHPRVEELMKPLTMNKWLLRLGA